ncbi:MAG: 4-phosphopantetheinyl transferase family protein [Lachnospiraceae bacterium]|nr:4-phosphopantetheinyl transferase family protein [Lachnospiraceae bacterium]
MFYRERNIIYCRKKKEIDRRFYEIWTRKEAYIKFVGKGFFIGLKSIDTLKESNSIQFQTQKRDVYLISICSTFLDKEIEIVEVLEEDIYNIAKKHLKPYK